MDTKLRGWTAVRIICITLILALTFTALNRVIACFIRTEETGIYADVILQDLSNNQNLFEQHMNNASYHAFIVAYFGSENAIEQGMHLMWFDNVEQHYHYNDDSNMHHISVENNFQLRTPDGHYYYDTVNETGFEGERHKQRAEMIAKHQQLSLFRNSLSALEALGESEGLLYHIVLEIPQYISQDEFNSMAIDFKTITDTNNNYYYSLSAKDINEYRQRLFEQSIDYSGEMRTVVYSNVDEYLANSRDDNIFFFRNQPVYFIADQEKIAEQSSGSSHYSSSMSRYENYQFSWSSQLFTFDSILLAYPSLVVSTMVETYSAVRDAYLVDITIVAVCAVLTLILTIILLTGAGRQYVRVEGKRERVEGVQFSPIDKPYLDLSFVLIFFWTVAILYLALILINEIWYHQNTTLTFSNIIIGFVTFLVVPPVLFWLMSLVKRLKAGQFWKHTLIYAILYSCIYGSLRFIIRKVISLWSGARLSLKVGLISFAAWFVLIFVGIVGRSSFSIAPVLLASVLITAVTAFLLTLYAKRIRNLETGANAAREGNYDVPISAGRGELGNIADSINSISAGINKAVEERMKSERLKTELITNVSHDIRTPLTSIITYTDLLEHEGLDCEKAPDYLDILKQKSLRLKTLTEELFEAAKASTGNIDVNLTDLNIVSLINQVMGELDNSVTSSGLNIKINLPDKLMARADGRLMQRVMENLLSNVFKYSLPNSRVYLDAVTTHNSDVRIDIKNISATELNFDPSELTERFKRGDDSRADGGSGLGLSIVQSFVEAQNGKFEISIDGDLFKATVLLPKASTTPINNKEG